MNSIIYKTYINSNSNVPGIFERYAYTYIYIIHYERKSKYFFLKSSVEFSESHWYNNFRNKRSKRISLYVQTEPYLSNMFIRGFINSSCTPKRQSFGIPINARTRQ